MQFSGSTEFVADRERVWSFLIDPTRLGACSPIPIQRVDDRNYRVEARLGSGLFGATVKANLQITEAEEHERATIVGKGGASGTTVEATSSFALRDGDIEGTTVVDWEVDFTLAGMFSGAVAKLIEDRAPVAIEQLLACVHGQIEGQQSGGGPRG